MNRITRKSASREWPEKSNRIAITTADRDGFAVNDALDGQRHCWSNQDHANEMLQPADEDGGEQFRSRRFVHDIENLLTRRIVDEQILQEVGDNADRNQEQPNR